MQRGFLGASSERSWQSNSPSHSHFFWLRQRPLAQRNSSGPHVGYSTPDQENEEYYIKRIINHILSLLCGQVSFKLSQFLSQGTKPTLTTFWRFIRAIGAVSVMVAYKVLGDTLSVLAHELILGITSVVGVHLKQKKKTLVIGHRTMFFFYIFFLNYKIQLTAASFDALISPIRAVLVSITLPTLRHTHVGARTLESLRTAGLGFCDSIMRKLCDDITSNINHWVWEKVLLPWWL